MTNSATMSLRSIASCFCVPAVPLLLLACLAGIAHAGIRIIPPTKNFDDDIQAAAIPDENCHLLQDGDLPTFGVTGRLVVARPVHACSAVQPTPRLRKKDDNLGHQHKWFLLVRHSPDLCSVDQQIIRARRAGFDGIIVYENEDDMNDVAHLRPVVGLDDGTPRARLEADLLRYVQFVQGRSYGRLLRRCTHDKGFLIHWTHPDKWSRMASVAVAVLIGCLVLHTCYALFVSDTNWANDATATAAAAYDTILALAHEVNHENEHETGCKKHLGQVVSDVYRWSSPTGGAEGEPRSCCVCMEDYRAGDKVRKLDCDHDFHAECIDTWFLDSKLNCPFCRQPVSFETEDSKLDSHFSCG